MNNLNELEKRLMHDLSQLEYQPKQWLPPSETLDVAIIGGGMAGLCASFALMREGIFNIRIYDEAPAGYEGPWATYAKMLILRSGKELAGPALGLSNLTYHAWHVAQFGEESWRSLYKIPTLQWMEYLRWYKKVLQVPVQNNAKVESLQPQTNNIALHFTNGQKAYAKKVVLATGRGGFGGPSLPSFVERIPKTHYAHTCELIDFKKFTGKRVLIVGSGASAFDAAAEALEHKASSVTILTRRDNLPQVNKFASTVYSGYAEGYHLLFDHTKIAIMENAKKVGTPPPFESLDRVKPYDNFKVLTGFKAEHVEFKNNSIHLAAAGKEVIGDYLICATGYAINGACEPLISPFIESCLLWGDRHPSLQDKLAAYPYLGAHYQFLEKQPAPFLKDIYCFNYAATMTHGLTSSDIPLISIGAQRLAKGIVADFFTEDASLYLQRFLDYNVKEFIPADYPFFA